MSPEITVQQSSGRKKLRGLYPLTTVPAGIETLEPPEVVTHLLDPHSNNIVTEGAKVVEGQPLCDNAVHGAFASMTGTVKRVAPWNGGPRGIFTAVTIAGTVKGTPQRLCDSIDDYSACTFSQLKGTCALFGHQLPEQGANLLVMLLDEDVGAVTNRWLLEKDFQRVAAGLRILNNMYGTGSVLIAVPASLSVDRQKSLAAYGRVLPVPERYPQVRAELILRENGFASHGKVLAIDAARVVDLGDSLTTGTAATLMQVSLRFGRKGEARLYRIPIGTRVGDFLAGCGMPIGNGMLVVFGGEMCGVAADTLEQPLGPDCTTVLVMERREVLTPENTPCVNCGRCFRNCPVGLRVDLLGKSVEFTKDEELVRLGISRCIDCGVCAAVCMVRRPLAHLMAYGKLRTEQSSGKRDS